MSCVGLGVLGSTRLQLQHGTAGLSHTAGLCTSSRVASGLCFIRLLAFQPKAKPRHFPGKADPWQKSRLALPGRAALWERACRDGGQRAGHRPTEERLWNQGLFSQKTPSGDHTATPGTCREVMEKMKPGCAQRCRVGGQEAAVYIETRGVQTGCREAFCPCEDSKW